MNSSRKAEIVNLLDKVLTEKGSDKIKQNKNTGGLAPVKEEYRNGSLVGKSEKGQTSMPDKHVDKIGNMPAINGNHKFPSSTEMLMQFM